MEYLIGYLIIGFFVSVYCAIFDWNDGHDVYLSDSLIYLFIMLIFPVMLPSIIEKTGKPIIKGRKRNV